MAEVLFRGPAPSSRSAMLGAALGEGLVSGYETMTAEREAVERYNPVREALLANLKGSALSPMQQALAGAASDPATFAKVMQDPNQLIALQTAGQMATPAAPPPESEEEAMLRMFDQAQAMRESGDPASMRRAQILEARAMKLAGVDQQQVQADIQKIVAMGLDPTTGEGYRLLAESIVGRAPTTNIQMPSPVNPAAAEYGRGIGERANRRVEMASAASTANVGLNEIERALDAGARTGTGQAQILKLKNLAQSLFGIELPDTAAEQEVIAAIQAQLMTEFRSTSEGGGLPGATSNRDLQLMATAVPGLAQTPAGNRLIIDYMRKSNQLKMDVAKEQQRIIDANNGVPPANLDSMLAEYVANQSVLTDAERARYAAVSQPTGGAMPGGVGAPGAAAAGGVDPIVEAAREYNRQRQAGAQ